MNIPIFMRKYQIPLVTLVWRRLNYIYNVRDSHLSQYILQQAPYAMSNIPNAAFKNVFHLEYMYKSLFR